MAREVRKLEKISTDEEDLIAKYGPLTLLSGVSFIAGFIIGRVTTPAPQGELYGLSASVIKRSNSQHYLRPELCCYFPWF